jgi:hypothetical protein
MTSIEMSDATCDVLARHSNVPGPVAQAVEVARETLLATLRSEARERPRSLTRSA